MSEEKRGSGHGKRLSVDTSLPCAKIQGTQQTSLFAVYLDPGLTANGHFIFFLFLLVDWLGCQLLQLSLCDEVMAHCKVLSSSCAPHPAHANINCKKFIP